ncbi:MAG: hypothetical protein HZC49_13375 [Nitrospirae bacterium]|nr:hypothetical protein [Nitrospirota bacterium]
MITDYYDPEDVKKGHIVSVNRQEEEVRFPIMSISVAIINTRQREISNPIQLGEIAAELKHYAKSRPGSVCISEKRQNGYKPGPGETIIRSPGNN